MTKSEAIELMRKGEKITHTNFEEGWMTMSGETLIFDEGTIYPNYMNWFGYRKGKGMESWKDGYSIFKED